MDCFASLAMTWLTLNTNPRSRDALRPRFSKNLPPKGEGAGNAGCALHPRSRVQESGSGRTRAYRAAESIRHFLRNGFTAYIELSPENGSFASVAPWEAVASRCIDASTATSGPHVFAVRVCHDRQSQPPRPPHPRPTFVTIASAPLVGTGWAKM